jgi:hypothetical protein
MSKPMCVEPSHDYATADVCLTCFEKRVREDERDCDAHGDTIRYRCSHYQQGRKDGYAAALRDAKKAVMAVTRGGWGLKVHEHYRNCIAAIEALGGER